MSETTTHFSEEYSVRIRQDYGDQIGDELEHWRSESPYGHEIEYVRLGQPGADPETKPILFINGFLAGIVANAPFGAEMASRGFDIILPDQDRQGIAANSHGKKNAAQTQALDTAAIIQAERLQNTPLDVVTHSFGSLVFDRLHNVANNFGWSCFDDSKVAMLTPSGIKPDETIPKFLPRWVGQLMAGKHLEKFPDSYWDFAQEMMVPAVDNFKANPTRALREGYEVATRRTHLMRLLRDGVGQIALIPSAQDVLYPTADYESLPIDYYNGRVTAFSPISLADYDDTIRSGRGADHSDHQFNPARVAGAVEQFLRS